MNHTLQVHQSGRVFTLTGQIEAPRGKLELRIESSRNRVISKFTDRSCRDINKTYRYISGPKVPIPGREIWWPVVDVELDHRMAAVAVFDHDASLGASYVVNGMFHDESFALKPTNRIEGRYLEHWENAISVYGTDAALTDFYLAVKIEIAPNGKLDEVLTLLSDDWSGRLSLWENRRELLSIEVSAIPEEPGYTPMQADGIEQSLLDAIAYILRSQNKHQHSPTYGGLYLFYDHDERAFRQNA